MAVEEPVTPAEHRPGGADLDIRCHWMLLRLSGLVPDELLTHARAWLADGRRGDVAAAVVQAAIAGRLAMDPADIALLRELYVQAGLPPTTVGQVIYGEPVVPDAVVPGLRFSSERPGAAAELAGSGPPGAGAGGGGDGAAAAESVEGQRDGVLDALLAEVEAVPSVRAVWLAWRSPANGAPWPAPRRVFVVETDDDTDMPALAARVQRALAAGGESAPQVEVLPTWAEPPSQARAARIRGALVYVRDPRPEIQFAEFFDEVDDSGGRIAPNHLILTGSERVHVLNYLSAGKIIASTSARAVDVLRPHEGRIVPVNIRTDGEWIWNDANWHYLHEYDLAPDLGLLAHIRARGYVIDRIDAVALRLATARLGRP